MAERRARAGVKPYQSRSEKLCRGKMSCAEEKRVAGRRKTNKRGSGNNGSAVPGESRSPSPAEGTPSPAHGEQPEPGTETGPTWAREQVNPGDARTGIDRGIAAREQLPGPLSDLFQRVMGARSLGGLSGVGGKRGVSVALPVVGVKPWVICYLRETLHFSDTSAFASVRGFTIVSLSIVVNSFLKK